MSARPEFPGNGVELILEAAFRRGEGFTWIADLPPEFAGPGDTTDDPAASRVRLFEDGRPLGPAHALHAEIRREGLGRYSHWNDDLLFSTSDGSDPNANGRRYSIALGPRTLKLLGFGSCHIHEALEDVHNRGLARRLWPDPGLSYSPGETLQLVNHHLGRLEVPEGLKPLAVSGVVERATVGKTWRAADVVLLEFGTGVEIGCGSYSLLREQLFNEVLNPIYAMGKAERRIASRWYQQGLIKGNETVRKECAEELVKILGRAKLEAVITSEIVQNARGSAPDGAAIVRTIDHIRELLAAKAVCIVSTQNVFTPDGRPVTWPGNFAKDLEPICRELGLPLMHQSKLVAERGVKFSLKRDLFHFTPEFISLLGDEMLAMARRALAAAEASEAAADHLC